MDFESRSEDDSEALERYTSQSQSIIASQGGLHIASVAPSVRAMMHFMPMRDDFKLCLDCLTKQGVPTYLFSSGLGDIVAQAVLQSANLEASGLPSNLRIVANFFRTAPDGTVRAFSQPVIHERNKFASTASLVMGMPLPQRPNAIVIGSHEQDLRYTATAPPYLCSLKKYSRLTEGLDISTKLSVGHLELTEDLTK